MSGTVSGGVLALGPFWLAGVGLVLSDIAATGDAPIQHVAGLVGCVLVPVVLYANAASSTEPASGGPRFGLG